MKEGKKYLIRKSYDSYNVFYSFRSSEHMKESNG